MKPTFAALAAALMISACSAVAYQAEQPEPASVAAYDAPAYFTPIHDSAHAASCDVRVRRTANGALIEARAFADRAFDGEYDLVITKSGGGGSADISQGGPLAMAAGEAVTLGENEISIERGARVRATLRLINHRGEVCRDSFRL